MAGELFPKAGPRPTRSDAERTVYKALARGLPDGWRAWHSLKLRVAGRWEGEGDFVIADPQRGFVVLEVKGGTLRLEDGCWSQNGYPMKKPPRDQAVGVAKNLASAIRKRDARYPAYEAACAFPDCDFSEGPTTGDLDGLVLGPHALEYLEHALPALFERALGKHARAPLDDRWLAILHELWGETWVPHVRLEDSVARAAERAVQLDEEQLQVLDIAGGIPSARVTGPAGSGKTLVARELCIRRARAGQRALYLCFTDALAAAVDQSLEAVRADGVNVRAAPLRRYACELLAARGETVEDTPAGWDAAPRRAAHALPAERPDLLVVDEAQDFDVSDWALVEALAAGRDLWLFHDDAQKFWTERTIPAAVAAQAATPLKLLRQHRNPPRIAALAAAYAPGYDASAAAAATASAAAEPAGRTASVRVVHTSEGELLAHVERELRALLTDGARPQDIAVLTLAGQTKSELLHRATLADQPHVRAHVPDARTHLIADTFLRFKGLERPFVILTEITRGKSSHYDTRMHIALTRATVALRIVCSTEAYAADPRLHIAG